MTKEERFIHMLTELVDTIGIRQDRLAEYLGVAKQTVWTWLRREKVGRKTLQNYYTKLRYIYAKQAAFWDISPIT